MLVNPRLGRSGAHGAGPGRGGGSSSSGYLVGPESYHKIVTPGMLLIVRFDEGSSDVRGSPRIGGPEQRAGGGGGGGRTS